MGDDRRRPILVVSATDLRAPNHGMLMRVRLTVDALSRVAPVEVAVVQQAAENRPPLRGSVPVAVERSRVFTFTRRLTVANRLRWLVRRGIPLNLVGRDLAGVRAELGGWMAPDYRLVWVVGTAVYDSVAPVLPSCPVVVDVNDLEADKLATELVVRRGAPVPAGTAGWGRRLHRRVALLQGRWNVAAWRRFDRRVAARATSVLVCSDADVPALGDASVVVVPNAYPTPERPRGTVEVTHPPTLLLQGNMTYPPNADAAEFLTGQILPVLRRDVPDVRLRIVGKADDRVRALADGERVTVTGYVPDMEAELEQADLVVVPVRYGGGTRIKIIEAFAHGIPVVSTRVGAFGLGAVDGHDILLADDAADCAAACARALTDEGLRRRLSRAGRERFDEHYRAESVRARIIDLAVRLAP